MPFRVEIELEQFYAGDPGAEYSPFGLSLAKLNVIVIFQRDNRFRITSTGNYLKEFRITNNEMIFNCYQYTYNSLTFGTQFGQN